MKLKLLLPGFLLVAAAQLAAQDLPVPPAPPSPPVVPVVSQQQLAALTAPMPTTWREMFARAGRGGHAMRCNCACDGCARHRAAAAAHPGGHEHRP